MEIGDITLHFLVGCVFALTGIYARQFCKHLRHQILVGGLMIFVEAVFTVWAIG